MNQLSFFEAAPIMARPDRPDTPMLLAMSSVYVMAKREQELKPYWRNGQCGTWQEMNPMQQGDLNWFAHDYRDHSKGGRWFYYHASESIWRCIDPFDTMGINDKPNTPPTINSSGSLI